MKIIFWKFFCVIVMEICFSELEEAKETLDQTKRGKQTRQSEPTTRWNMTQREHALYIT